MPLPRTLPGRVAAATARHARRPDLVDRLTGQDVTVTEHPIDWHGVGIPGMGGYSEHTTEVHRWQLADGGTLWLLCDTLAEIGGDECAEALILTEHNLEAPEAQQAALRLVGGDRDGGDHFDRSGGIPVPVVGWRG